MKRVLQSLIAVSTLTGCAGLSFGPESPTSLTYYDSRPYLFITTTPDCVSAATVISVPGAKRGVTFNSGYGTADLSLNLSGGMITSVGQKTDTKIPETIGAVATLATAVGGLARSTSNKADGGCPPSATLYKIENGIIDPVPVISK